MSPQRGVHDPGEAAWTESEPRGAWYVCRPGGSPQGPLSSDGVIEAIQRGILREDAQVCEAFGEQRVWRAIVLVDPFRASLEGRTDVSLRPVYAPPGVDTDFEDALSTIPTANWPRVKPPPTPPPAPSPVVGPAALVPPMIAEAPGAYGPPAPDGGALPALGGPLPSVGPATHRPPARAGGRWWVAPLAGLGLGVVALGVAALVIGIPGVPTEEGSSGAAPSSAEAADAPPATPTDEADAPVAGKGSVEQGATGGTRAAPDDGALAKPAHPCERSRTPKALCEWVVALAEERTAKRPTFDELQIFLLDEGFDRAKGRVLGEAVAAGKSNTGQPLYRYQATSSGVYGYCLQSTSSLVPGSFYTLWVRRTEGTSKIELSTGKVEECVLLEHEELPGTLTDLLQMSPADPEVAATALRALSQITAYDRAR